VQPTAPSIDATVLIEELKRNYKKDNDTIYNLYDIVSKENITLKEEIASLEQKFDKLKQENSDLFDENTRLILEINQRKDNLQVDDDDVLKKKIIETTPAPTVKKSNTLKRALPPVKSVTKKL
jgi:regulator of replication initiation timing